MLRNRRLARSIADGGFYELRRQINYKARLYGARVIVADRWYPSSKTCCCGVIKETLALAKGRGRKFCGVSLWSAKRWPDSQEPGETVQKQEESPVLSEAA
jgi:putative transposase